MGTSETRLVKTCSLIKNPTGCILDRLRAIACWKKLSSVLSYEGTEVNRISLSRGFLLTTHSQAQGLRHCYLHPSLPGTHKTSETIREALSETLDLVEEERITHGKGQSPSLRQSPHQPRIHLLAAFHPQWLVLDLAVFTPYVNANCLIAARAHLTFEL